MVCGARGRVREEVKPSHVPTRAPQFVAPWQIAVYADPMNYIKSAYVWIGAYTLVGLAMGKETMQAAPLLIMPLIAGLLAWGLCALLKKLRIE
jgi:hypothetical protein